MKLKAGTGKIDLPIFVLALVLLLTIDFSFWVVLIFPSWVFAVSVYILVRNLRHQSLESPGGMRE